MFTCGAGAVIFPLVRGRILAMCFGHVHIPLNDDAFERQFGLKVGHNGLSIDLCRCRESRSNILSSAAAHVPTASTTRQTVCCWIDARPMRRRGRIRARANCLLIENKRMLSIRSHLALANARFGGCRGRHKVAKRPLFDQNRFLDSRGIA